MKSKKPPVIRNFVHKASIEINKPKVHRDRTKEYKNRTLKYEDYELDHPKHKPYKREHMEDEFNGDYENGYDEEDYLPEDEEWYECEGTNEFTELWEECEPPSRKAEERVPASGVELPLSEEEPKGDAGEREEPSSS